MHKLVYITANKLNQVTRNKPLELDLLSKYTFILPYDYANYILIPSKEDEVDFK
ncbi:hypothetical protein [Bacillus sp. FJAT-25509]|uniref:hypothetical protein n=1 Tax=Bacillus sp. FJAT-25509 TaxID=1712029 RepID=UPI000AC1A106|nr:hypothetical protein [Bacillus sp. FJAT-25509]